MSTIVSLIALFCCAISRTIFYFYWAIRSGLNPCAIFHARAPRTGSFLRFYHRSSRSDLAWHGMEC